MVSITSFNIKKSLSVKLSTLIEFHLLAPLIYSFLSKNLNLDIDIFDTSKLAIFFLGSAGSCVSVYFIHTDAWACQLRGQCG